MESDSADSDEERDEGYDENDSDLGEYGKSRGRGKHKFKHVSNINKKNF